MPMQVLKQLDDSGFSGVLGRDERFEPLADG